MKKKLLIVGGIANGEIDMSIFEDINSVSEEWDLVGYLSDIKHPGENIGKHVIVGTTDEIEHYVNQGYYIHNALYFNAKDKENRVNKFKKLNVPLEANATGIHPTAIIAPEVKIGYGVLINQYALAQTGCRIENFVHIYSGSLVGHGSHINNYCTIGAHSIVGGRVILKEGCHIGLNASLREDITIGKYSIIGMGSVVIKDVEDKETVAGNPATVITKSSG